jgi:Glycosyltransferase family 87
LSRPRRQVTDPKTAGLYEVLTRAAAVVIVTTLVTVGALIWIQMRSRIAASDFIPVYIAAQQVKADSAAAMYDMTVQTAAQAKVDPSWHAAALPYLNPPAFAVSVLPLSYLSADAATLIWSLGQLVMFIAAAAIAVRGSPATGWRKRTFGIVWAVTAVAVSADIAYGQNTGVVALGLAVCYALWRTERPLHAAAVLGATAALTKPHLLLGLALFAIARDRWKACGGLLIGAGVVGVIPAILFGPGIYADFFGALTTYQNNRQGSLSVGIPGLGGDMLSQGFAAELVTATGIAAALVATIFLGSRSRSLRGDALWPAVMGATCLSLLLPTHVMPYDVSILVPLVAVAVSRTGTRRELIWPSLWLLASLATDLDFRGLLGWVPKLHVIMLTLLLFTVVAWIRTQPGLRRLAGAGRPG